MEAIGEGRNSAVAHPPWDGGAGRLSRGLGDAMWAGVSTGIFALLFARSPHFTFNVFWSLFSLSLLSLLLICFFCIFNACYTVAVAAAVQCNAGFSINLPFPIIHLAHQRTRLHILAVHKSLHHPRYVSHQHARRPAHHLVPNSPAALFLQAIFARLVVRRAVVEFGNNG
jgi:hypothetical protein